MRLSSVLMLFVALVGGPQVVNAQSAQETQIQSRLDEIKKMMDEEIRTIGVLEDQLKRAIDSEQEAQVERIRLEIEQGWTRVDALKELNKRLDELMETASMLDEELDLARRPQPQPGNARDRKVPQSRIAGLETREDIEKAKRELMGEQDEAQADQQEPREDPAPRLKLPGENAPRTSTRLQNLERSLQALKDAGEFDLVRQVEQLIRREQGRLASEREPSADDQRQPELRHPAAADPPPQATPGRQRPPREPARSENDELRDLVTQMRDEIRRLRQEVNELKNAHSGGDQNDQ
ncbi:MAG: hypothetical protein ACR2NP_22350 [Pirellulaceae bacterium]